MRLVGDVHHVRLGADAARARLHVGGARGFVGDERVGARQAVGAFEVRHLVVADRRHRVRPAARRAGVDHPHQLRRRRVGDVPARRPARRRGTRCTAGCSARRRSDGARTRSGNRAAPSRWLGEAARPTNFGRRGSLRSQMWITRHAAEARLAGARIEQTRALRPVSLVRAPDERAAAPGAAVAGRRAGDLGDERDLRRVGVARRDVEDLELELLAGVVAANQVVASRRLGVEAVVVDHRHRARVHVRLIVRDVPDESRACRVRDLDDRRAVPLHLAGDGIEDRLVVALAVVGRLRIAAVVRRVADVDPVAVGGIRLRRDHQRLAALQIVVADQPHVARHRRSAGRPRRASRSRAPGTDWASCRLRLPAPSPAPGPCVAVCSSPCLLVVEWSGLPRDDTCAHDKMHLRPGLKTRPHVRLGGAG